MGFLDDTLRQLAQNGNVPQPLVVIFQELLTGQTPNDRGQQSASTTQQQQQQQQSQNQQAANPAAGQQEQAGGVDLGALGGLGALLQQLQSAGLEDAVRSWIGNGENKPVQPDHLGPALGTDAVSQMADKAGCSQDDLLSQLAKALPGLIDTLTNDNRAGSPGGPGQRFGGH